MNQQAFSRFLLTPPGSGTVAQEADGSVPPCSASPCGWPAHPKLGVEVPEDRKEGRRSVHPPTRLAHVRPQHWAQQVALQERQGPRESRLGREAHRAGLGWLLRRYLHPSVTLSARGLKQMNKGGTVPHWG